MQWVRSATGGSLGKCWAFCLGLREVGVARKWGNGNIGMSAMRHLGSTLAWLEFLLTENPPGRGLAYFCEESVHGVSLSSGMAVLLLTILGMEAFAGSAEIFGHASDCLVFLFKCLPLLQLFDKRTHVIYLITLPEIHSLTLFQEHQAWPCHRHTRDV